MARLTTDVLVIGSGAGGATTGARLAEARRNVLIVEEGPWVDADLHEPFSLEELAAKYRNRGPQVALGQPVIAYAEGRCVGGSTEINSGLFHRLPDYLAAEWRQVYDIDEFGPETLAGYAADIESEMGVSKLPGAPPLSSAVLERGATKLGWEHQEFARVFRYDDQGRGTKQTMSRTMIPRALAAGAQLLPDCRVLRLLRHRRGQVVGARCQRTHPDGGRESLDIFADHVVLCAGAIHTPALLQRSGIRAGVGRGLKMHPHIRLAARFPHPVDHADVPMHRVTEFAPHLTIGGSASRRGYVAVALAETTPDFAEALEDWQSIALYYATIRTEGEGRVVAIPGLKSPLVFYGLTEADLSYLARGLIRLGETLLAAGAVELYPSIAGGTVARDVEDLGRWYDQVTRADTNLLAIHLTSTVRMGQNRARSGADSFGRVWGQSNLYVSDASLLPDAPGVNPQAAVMTLARRNADHFLADT